MFFIIVSTSNFTQPIFKLMDILGKHHTATYIKIRSTVNQQVCGNHDAIKRIHFWGNKQKYMKCFGNRFTSRTNMLLSFFLTEYIKDYLTYFYGGDDWKMPWTKTIFLFKILLPPSRGKQGAIIDANVWLTRELSNHLGTATQSNFQESEKTRTSYQIQTRFWHNSIRPLSDDPPRFWYADPHFRKTPVSNTPQKLNCLAISDLCFM